MSTAVERVRQDERWGQQDHPDGTGPTLAWNLNYEQLSGGPWALVEPQIPHGDRPRHVAKSLEGAYRYRCQQRTEDGTVSWADIYLEELAEVLAEDDTAKLRRELLQGAAVLVARVEAIDRRPMQ